MKRFAAVLLAVCMAVTLGACKAPKQIGESSTGENKKEEKVEVEGLKVGYLFSLSLFSFPHICSLLKWPVWWPSAD